MHVWSVSMHVWSIIMHVGDLSEIGDLSDGAESAHVACCLRETGMHACVFCQLLGPGVRCQWSWCPECCMQWLRLEVPCELGTCMRVRNGPLGLLAWPLGSSELLA